MTTDKNTESDKSIGKLCHDLRNPLSVMRMTLDLFEMSPEYRNGPPELAELVDKLNKQIDAILGELSKVEKV